MKQLVVAPDSSDRNATGSEANPYSTIEQALRNVAPGDTILLRGGEYHQFTKISTGGKSNAPLTIAAYPGESPYLVGLKSKLDILQIDAPYVFLEGLTFCPIQCSTSKSPWLSLTPNARGAKLTDLSLFRKGDVADLFAQNLNDFGIIVEAPDVTITGCRLAGMCKGIHVKGKESTGVTITNNHIGPTIQSNIVLSTSYGVVRGVLIAFNLLEGSYREDGIQFMQDFGSANPANDVSNMGAIVYHNVIRDQSENGIDLKGTGQIVIDGNVITRVKGSNDGLAFGGNRNSMGVIMKGANASSEHVIERNNVIYNASSGVRLYEQYKVYNNVILWNMFDYTGSGSDYRNPNRPTFVGVLQGAGVVKKVALKNNIIGLHEEDVRLLPGKSEIEVDGNLFVNDKKTLPSLLTNATPLTENHTLDDFTCLPQSAASGVGVPLTETIGSGRGKVVPLRDAGYFTDWFGRKDLPAEVIYLGSQACKIVRVNYASNEVEVDQEVAWTDKMPVSCGAAKANIGLQLNQSAVEIKPDPLKPVEPEIVRLVLELSVPPDQVDKVRQLLQGIRVTLQ